MIGSWTPTDLRVVDPRPMAPEQTLAVRAADTVLERCPDGAAELLAMLGIDGPVR